MVPTGTIPLFPHIAPSRETKKRSGGGGGDAHYNKNNPKETGGVALLAKEEAAAAATTAAVAAAAEALSPGAHSVSVIPCLVALSLMESLIMETRLSCHI